jgi:hypothetical protein
LVVRQPRAAMRLHHWTHSKRDIEFDPTTGSGRTVALPSLRPDDAPLTGYAAFERRFLGERMWFAIFRRGESIVFHAGTRHWHAGAPGLEFVHRHPFPLLSRFEIHEAGTRVFTFTYSHLGRLLFALNDPTYDKIDQDADFFLEFVAEQANSSEWRENVLTIWRGAQAV